MEKGSVGGPPKRIIAACDGRQLVGPIQKERSRPQPATSPGVSCGVLERTRYVLVLLVDRCCELPRARLGVVEELRESLVDLTPANRVGSLVRTGGQQRMREADPRPVESDDPRLERWCQPLVGTDARCFLDHLFHGLWVRSRCEQVVAARRGQCREPRRVRARAAIRARAGLAGLGGAPVRWSVRTISSAKNGFPPDA